MIVRSISENVNNEDVTVGIRFISEDEKEKDGFRNWFEHKNIGNISDDNKVIDILFKDISSYLKEYKGD